VSTFGLLWPVALPNGHTRSSDPGQDVFCLQDGTPVQDNMTLGQYLELAVSHLPREIDFMLNINS
jgi:hypothetical protein